MQLFVNLHMAEEKHRVRYQFKLFIFIIRLLQSQSNTATAPGLFSIIADIINIYYSDVYYNSNLL